ncbi:MAG: hypothetical protein V8Q27_09515 [Eubacteriales bacterium]
MQLIWGDMQVEAPDPAKVRMYLTELDSSVAFICLDTMTRNMKTTWERPRPMRSGKSYRVRYTQQRMYLLNYDRTVDRIFDPALSIFTKNEVDSGILNTEVEYKKNPEENIVAFVQNGQLWCYDVWPRQLFGIWFPGGEMYLRGQATTSMPFGSWDVDESGSMNFLVYGYMNRGTDEGQTGVSLCTYDALTNTVEERAFLSSDRSFAVLEAQLGKMAYVNRDQQFYLYLDGSVLCVDLNTMEETTVAMDVAKESGMVSEDGHLAAWHEANTLYEAGSVSVLNLDTGSSHTIRAEDGYYIQALGFMGTDFIYGEARQADVTKELSGNYVFPMERLSSKMSRERWSGCSIMNPRAST